MNSVFNWALLLLLLANVLATLWVRRDVRKIELATNSMKDDLVEAVREASHAAGREEGQRDGEETAATLAKGQSQGREQEIARAAANAPLGPLVNVSSPVPVADDRVAVAAERSAGALERTATSAEEKTK